MQGKPIQDALGDFPDYTDNDKIEDQLNTAIFTKNVDFVHQAVMLSLKTSSHRGLLIVGFSATAFSNGAYPLTKFDRAWFYVLMKPKIEAVLGRLL